MDDREKLLWIDAQVAGSLAEGPLAGELFADDADARDLSERVQQCDKAVRRSLDDVNVPQGLSSRILARLASARAESTPAMVEDAPAILAMSTDAASTFPPEQTQPDQSPQTPISRRRWFWRSAAAALFVGTGGLSLYSYLNRPSAELGAEDLWYHFHDQFAQQSARAKAGRPFLQAPRAEFPVCDLTVGASVRGWQPVNTLDRSGVCYFLQSGNEQAVLWVLPLVGNPPIAPHLTTEALEASQNTGGVTVSVWKSSDLLYVLAGSDVTAFAAKGRRLT